MRGSLPCSKATAEQRGPVVILGMVRQRLKESTPIASSLAAIASIIAATTCCLPIGILWLAAATAGAGAVLDRYRLWLVGLSVALIAFGFWQARRARSCTPRRRRLNVALLLLSTFFVGASLLLPAYWTIGSHKVPSGQRDLRTLASAELLRAEWNAARGPKVLVLLSPT